MSKTGNWVIAMQEDAYYMTLTEFNKTYGDSNSDVWHEVQLEAEAEGFAEVLEMDDGA
jgi:hypothetical protein|tara:strand:+ start:86 stop:259 length:174 start_codon:yes stop_codon:yes gene_type:complete